MCLYGSSYLPWAQGGSQQARAMFSETYTSSYFVLQFLVFKLSFTECSNYFLNFFLLGGPVGPQIFSRARAGERMGLARKNLGPQGPPMEPHGPQVRKN